MKPGADYSKTAINLINPNETKEALEAWHKASKMLAIHENALANTDEAKLVAKASADVNTAWQKVKETIDRAGSYQDVASGQYALAYQRETVTYNLEKLRGEHALEPYINAITDETVNVTKLKGLLKGGLVPAEAVARCEEHTKLSPSYIINVVEAADAENSQASG